MRGIVCIAGEGSICVWLVQGVRARGELLCVLQAKGVYVYGSTGC